MKFSAWMSALVVGLMLLLGSVYVVSEGQAAIVLNLGKVVRNDIGPGLHFKLPMIESARVFDRRLMVLAAEPERYLTSEKKDVSVDFFAIGRIENVRDFYRATGGDESAAADRLAPIIKDSLRNEINSRTLQEVVSGDRTELIAKQMAPINSGASTLGIKIVDLRLKLGCDSAEYNDFTVVIVPNVRGRVVGAVVGHVADVVELAGNTIRPAPQLNANIDAGFITGICLPIDGGFSAYSGV